MLHTDPSDDFGTSAFTTTTLSRGLHTLTLAVTDSLDLTTTDLITFTVNGLPAFCARCAHHARGAADR